MSCAGAIFATMERWADGPFGVFADLKTSAGLELYTVERGWRNNEPFVSCIPAGTYGIHKGDFRGKYPDLELDVGAVPGRSAIEIHRANLATSLQGCIAPGLRLGLLGDAWAVISSQKALEDLLRAFDRHVESGGLPQIKISWRTH